MSMASFHSRKPKGRPAAPSGATRQAPDRGGQERADVLLVRHGLAPSRAVAQRLIEAGRLTYAAGNGEETVKKASQLLPVDAGLRLLAGE